VTHVLSVDVEDYFQVEAFAGVVKRREWDSLPSRVVANTHRVLDLLDDCGVSGTFFILGWVAERFPELVAEIVRRGHEPACHSYWHRLVYTLDPEEFRLDTRRAKSAIEQAAGVPVYGYRAPSFSMIARSLWAAEVLVESGFRYDSSVFPIHHDIYGIPDAPRRVFRIQTRSGTLTEYPLSTFRLLGSANLPVGGGGYLRIFPFWYTRHGLARRRVERLPLVVYVHPWEFDEDQPRIPAPLRSRLRHYTNLRRMPAKLRRLIRLGRFSSFRSLEADRLNAAERYEVINVAGDQTRQHHTGRTVLEPRCPRVRRHLFWG
jgi:polysaccharide deacetylase family protein (PEP-CTERM system associated)